MRRSPLVVVLSLLLLLAYAARRPLAGWLEEWRSGAGAASASVQETPPGSREAWVAEHLRWGAPKLEDGEQLNATLIVREGYALLHDNDLKIPRWVCYRLDPEDYRTRRERTNQFEPDPDLPPGASARDADYRRSGYDRGHMAPAADMRRTASMMCESFYYANIAPQTDELNRGPWRQLEEQIRDWAGDKGRLWIAMGPLFEPGKRPRRIGPGKVAAPPGFWKVIVAERYDGSLAGVAFAMKNDEAPRPYDQCALSIDVLEARAGIDLFSDLPDVIENALERAAPSRREWPMARRN